MIEWAPFRLAEGADEAALLRASEALQEGWKKRKPLVWNSVIPYLDPACEGAVEYVEDIAR